MLPQLYDNFQHWGVNGGVWIMSDPHFGDKELRAGMPNRPTDEELIKRINQKVGKNGYLICLGDVGNIEIAKCLKGYKILVCGNHDVGHTVYKEVFDEVYSGPLMIGEKLILSHEPLPNMAWALNVHGHDHQGAKRDKYYLNVCLDVIDYEPINFNQLLKSGITSKIESIHRSTIDDATKRKKKRSSKPICSQRSQVLILDDSNCFLPIGYVEKGFDINYG